METGYGAYGDAGRVGSYPTYEEWKHANSIADTIAVLRSYPTYEEWKLLLIFVIFLTILCSYPTYEEWKLVTDKKTITV